MTNNRILKLNLVVQECKLMTIASMIFRQTTKIIPCRKGVFQFHTWFLSTEGDNYLSEHRIAKHTHAPLYLDIKF